MRSWTIRLTAATGVVAFWIAFSPAQPAAKTWYKGNLHTHTLNSDGDSPPADVAAWYKNHDYRFLVLSDHNVLTDVAPLNETLAAPGRFLLISGEEVTDRFGERPVHINGFGMDKVVKPSGGASLVPTIQGNVDAIRAASALPSVNHPNFRWAFSSKELLGIENLRLFEVHNGHPQVNNRGGGGAESLEEMWDTLLTAGRRIHGVAVDDAHHFKKIGKEYSNPGRGWVVVRAAELSASAILGALERGDFYASTGVELRDVQAAGREMHVTIQASPTAKYTTWFIGEGGKVLAKSFDNEAVYRLQENDKYVRAVVRSSNGDDAWTQPLFR